MTNDQIRERIALLKELIELEQKLLSMKSDAVVVDTVKSDAVVVDAAPWYPNNRNWIEYDPSMNVDRSMVAEVLYKRERESNVYGNDAPIQTDFTTILWDDEFSWSAGGRNIVAVVLKNNL